MAYQIGEIPKLAIQQVKPKSFHPPDLRTLSFDEVLELLALIESDEFENNLSMNELDQINQFISVLAMEGATNDEKLDIGHATVSLFQKNEIQYALFTDSPFRYSVTPAIILQDADELILCKGWWHKQWDHTKEFVKKHKKAIIIGAIVVVTVGVVVVAAVVISSAVAGTVAASGLATAGGVVDGSDPKYAENGCFEPVTSPAESLTSSLLEEISTFKETVAHEQFAAASEANGISIEENGRIMGSLFAHKAMDTVMAKFSHNPFPPQ